MEFPITVGISARHLHLCREHMDILFGEGSELTPKSAISQPGQYAAQEQVTIITSKSTMKLRVIGPLRPETQIELSFTDSRALGINPPVRGSGDLKGSLGIKIVGPKGEVNLPEGVIIVARHLHLCPETAAKYGLKDGDMVSFKSEGLRSCIMNNVLVRTGIKHADELHIDTDEGNACCLGTGDQVMIITE